MLPPLRAIQSEKWAMKLWELCLFRVFGKRRWPKERGWEFWRLVNAVGGQRWENAVPRRQCLGGFENWGPLDNDISGAFRSVWRGAQILKRTPHAPAQKILMNIIRYFSYLVEAARLEVKITLALQSSCSLKIYQHSLRLLLIRHNSTIFVISQRDHGYRKIWSRWHKVITSS